MAKTKQIANPEGINQWTIDNPKQAKFIEYYTDPKSLTFGNAYQSAIQAKFKSEYAKKLISQMPDWLSEKLQKLKSSNLMEKVEGNLNKILDLPHQKQAMGMFGPVVDRKTKKPVMISDYKHLELILDASKFLAERIGKGTYGKEEDVGGNRVLIINISPETAQRYGIKEVSKESTLER